VFAGWIVPRIVARIAIVAAMGVGACAQLPQDAQALHAAAKTAYAEASPIADGANAAPPPGFVSFCMQSPQACTNRGPDIKVTVDDRTAALLVSVNNAVNRSITYESDFDHYGVANRWTLDAVGGYGDCKDFALAKREALRAAGLPDSALRIAIVRTASGGLHAVLTVDTDRGVLVMDSLTPDILPWSDAPYRWLIRQASDSPLHWVMLADEADPIRNAVLAGDPQRH
jgi:predicted transglutaminase-like cysteine proteinase